MALEEKEKQIINHYGVMAQLDYFPTEIYELIEAIIQYEKTIIFKRSKKHITEELADCEMMLDQFKIKFYYSEYDRMLKFPIPKKGILRATKYLAKNLGKFIQAVTKHNTNCYSYETMSYFVKKEIAYIEAKLYEIRDYYGIKRANINAIKEFKADRQLERIANEHN